MSNTIALDLAKRLERLVIPNEEADARRRRYEQVEARAKSEELFLKAGVPKRHAEQALNPCLIDPAHAWTKTRAQVFSMLGRGVTLCLTGIRGNGKTQLGVDAILNVTRQGRPALFLTAQRVFMTFKGAFDEGAKRTEMQVLEHFRRPSLLVIDEVGQRTESGWENRTMFELLNARYGDMTDTILTCNLDRSTILENLGPSIVSRMTEGGGIIECNWPSFRGATP